MDSVEEYLTTALKRVYVSDELPFEPELSYDEECDYQNEHGIDLTQEQKLAAAMQILPKITNNKLFS